MTSRLPYIPFYHEAFFSGTSGLTAVERGVFITLLCLMWEGSRGPLSASDVYLARQCGTTVPAFRKALSTLMDAGKIERDARGLYNARALAEIEEREGRVARATDAGVMRQRRNTRPPKPAETHQNDPKLAERTASYREGDRDRNPPPKRGRANACASACASPCPWKEGAAFPKELRTVAEAAFVGLGAVPWAKVEAALAEFIDYRTNRAPPSQALLTDWPRAFANDLKTKLQKGFFDEPKRLNHGLNNRQAPRPGSTHAGLARAFGLDSHGGPCGPENRPPEPHIGGTIDAAARELSR